MKLQVLMQCQTWYDLQTTYDYGIFLKVSIIWLWNLFKGFNYLDNYKNAVATSPFKIWIQRHPVKAMSSCHHLIFEKS